jgi:hypothetical protein
VHRRQGRSATAVIAIVAILGFVLFLGQLFAQEGEVPEEAVPEEMAAEEMGPGAMGGPGAAAPRGGALAWTDETDQLPKELTKTYDDFLAETRLPRALIPDYFVFEKDGTPKKYTKNQWSQLHRIYATRRAVAVAEERIGRPGGGLAERVTNELAAKDNERQAVRELYEQGLVNFWFEIGYPQVRSQDLVPGVTAVPVEIGVIMHVKPNVAKRYPSLVHRRLQKFDNYGVDRAAFRIVDYEGGVWNPKVLWLWNGSITEWNSLWSQNVVTLTLYDVDGGRIVSGQQAAGLSGDICAKLVYPDELNYAPIHELNIPPRDYAFEGGKLNLDYKKGWYYSFSFTLPVAQLGALDRAEAMLIGAGGVEGSRSATQAAPSAAALAGASRAAVQAGTGRAMDTARTYLPMMRQQVPPLVPLTPF